MLTFKYLMSFEISVEFLNTLDQEDPILSDYIRNHLWIPAVPKSVPYALDKPNLVDYTEGQWPAILDVFKNHVRFSSYLCKFINLAFCLDF